VAAFLHSIDTGAEAPVLAEDLKFQVRCLMTHSGRPLMQLRHEADLHWQMAQQIFDWSVHMINPNSYTCDEVVRQAPYVALSPRSAQRNAADRETAFEAASSAPCRSFCEGPHSTATGGLRTSYSSRTASSDGGRTLKGRVRPPRGMPQPRRQHGSAAANHVRKSTGVLMERRPPRQHGATRCAELLTSQPA